MPAGAAAPPGHAHQQPPRPSPALPGLEDALQIMPAHEIPPRRDLRQPPRVLPRLPGLLVGLRLLRRSLCEDCRVRVPAPLHRLRARGRSGQRSDVNSATERSQPKTFSAGGGCGEATSAVLMHAGPGWDAASEEETEEEVTGGGRRRLATAVDCSWRRTHLAVIRDRAAKLVVEPVEILGHARHQLGLPPPGAIQLVRPAQPGPVQAVGGFGELCRGLRCTRFSGASAQGHTVWSPAVEPRHRPRPGLWARKRTCRVEDRRWRASRSDAACWAMLPLTRSICCCRSSIPSISSTVLACRRLGDSAQLGSSPGAPSPPVAASRPDQRCFASRGGDGGGDIDSPRSAWRAAFCGVLPSPEKSRAALAAASILLAGRGCWPPEAGERRAPLPWCYVVAARHRRFRGKSVASVGGGGGAACRFSCWAARHSVTS